MIFFFAVCVLSFSHALCNTDISTIDPTTECLETCVDESESAINSILELANGSWCKLISRQAFDSVKENCKSYYDKYKPCVADCPPSDLMHEDGPLMEFVCKEIGVIQKYAVSIEVGCNLTTCKCEGMNRRTCGFFKCVYQCFRKVYIERHHEEVASLFSDYWRSEVHRAQLSGSNVTEDCAGLEETHGRGRGDHVATNAPGQATVDLFCAFMAVLCVLKTFFY